MPFARASSLDRLLACAGGAILGGLDEKSDRAKEAADWGTLVHHWKATGKIKQVNGWKNHPKLFKRKLEKSGVKREDWWPEPFFHEHTLAWNVVDGQVEELPFCADADAWKKSLDDRYCTGTADGHAWLFDSVLWVDDLKTGRNVELEQHEQQLLFYALVSARALDYRGDVDITLTHWPRYPNHGQPRRIGKVITQDDLRDFEKRLRNLRDEILRGREGVSLNPGDCCLWCPSRGVCPAYESENN